MSKIVTSRTIKNRDLAGNAFGKIIVGSIIEKSCFAGSAVK